MKRDLYEFEVEFEELMDNAVNELSPKDFKEFVDAINKVMPDYED